jgi:hypothetical protein
MATIEQQMQTKARVAAQPTREQLLARIAELEALRAAARPGLSFKVSEKGALSVYGIQRFPVTLYVDQWERIIAPEQLKVMRDFIVAHKDELNRKA